MPTHSWEPDELADIGAAAAHAPSVLNTKPWILRLHGSDIHVVLDRTRQLPGLDPSDRQRVISCGAAVTNIATAVRALGWLPEILPLPQAQERNPLAVVRAVRRGRPGPEAVRLRKAIDIRYSNRDRYQRAAVPVRLVRLLERVGRRNGVRVAEIRTTELPTVAMQLWSAAEGFRADARVQSDVDAWMRHQLRPPVPGGIEASGLDSATCTGAGLFRRCDLLPGPEEIAADLSLGTVFRLTTGADGDRDHLLAGMALQDVLLTATDHGIATSVIISALERDPARARLTATFRSGRVQLLVRAGWPVTTTWQGRDHPSGVVSGAG